MASSLVLAVCGMGLLAFGVSRTDSRARRRTIAILLCVCGLVPIGTAAVGAGSNWGLRIGAMGAYSAAGAWLGMAAATISGRRHAGVILVSFGKVGTGLTIVWLICALGGMLGVVIQALDGPPSGSLFFLV